MRSSSRRQHWSSELELKALAIERMAQLKQQGAPISISASACEGVFSATLTMLEGRGFVESKNGLLRASGESLDVLNYYANSIAQWRA